MLKTRITPGEELDRGLEILARNLSRLLEAGVREGVIRIVSYPSLDPLTAGSVLYRVARGLGARPVITVTPRPGPLREPSILLGFHSPGLKSGDFKDHLLVIASKGIKGGPPPGAVYLEVDGSVSSAVGLALYNARMGGEDLLPLLAASYTSSYVDQAGRFHGLDREWLDALASIDGLGLEMYTGVKVYNPHKWPSWRSLASTVNPYLAGFTGDPEACREWLEANNVDPWIKPSSLDTGVMEKLASSLLEAVSRRRPVEAVRVIGGVVVARGREVLGDLRMAADVFRYVADVGGHGLLAGLILDTEDEYPMAEALLEAYSRHIRDRVERPPVKVKVAPWLKAYKAALSSLDSPTLVWRGLEMLGYVERDSLLLYEDPGHGLTASAIQAEEALGGDAVKKLVDSRVAVLDGLKLRVRVESGGV
ncbi:MAG: hypothetical protein GSR86_08190 [Desulfurococcales archaeon]|nr:hypothetical protein [Desulfurococcales archaeon]